MLKTTSACIAVSAVITIISLTLAGCRSERKNASGALYDCDSFTLFADSIIDGTHSAYAPDDSTIISTFRTDAEADTLHIAPSSIPLRYSSGAHIIDAVHNMSLIRLDSLPANISTASAAYLVDLALCYIAPEQAKTLLRSKVRDGIVYQGSSYGGGFPVATDGIAWAAAAWSIYEVTGDHSWLEEAYSVVSKTLDIYDTVIRDKESGLFKGTQSTAGNDGAYPYPYWMTPSELSSLQTITVNVLTARAYEAASLMAMALGKDGKVYMERHNDLVEAINTTLWMPNQSMYSMYLYGEPYPIAAGATDNLGQGLSMVYNIATPEMSQAMQSHTPVLPLGISAMYPQMPDSIAGKSDAIVPAVEAYWAIAASHTGNTAMMQRMLGSLIYTSAMNHGTYPYFSTDTGRFTGAPHYAARHNPLGAAANLAAIYRGIIGLRFTQGGIEIHPSIVQSADSHREIRNLHYRDALLHILVNGTGTVISSYKMDGAEQTSHTIPSNIKGTHVIEITMGGNTPRKHELNEARNEKMPPIPTVNVWDTRQLHLKDYVEGDAYEVYLNGVFEEQIYTDRYNMFKDIPDFTAIAFVPVRSEEYIGLSSRPSYFYPKGSVITIPADSLAYTGTSLISDRKIARQFVETTESYRSRMNFSVLAPASGQYLMECVYSNALANGSARSGLCAFRLISVNDSIAGTLVMPPTVKDEWTTTTRSNLTRVNLNEGENRISIIYRKPYTVNGHATLNNALIKTIRFYRL